MSLTEMSFRNGESSERLQRTAEVKMTQNKQASKQILLIYRPGMQSTPTVAKDLCEDMATPAQISSPWKNHQKITLTVTQSQKPKNT